MPNRQKDWINIIFLSLTPILGVFGTAAYALRYGVRWWEPALFFVLFGLVSVSVTAGYHRCFSHKSYRCHPAVQAFYLFFGALALQNSALKWSADHREHHRYVDRDWDPYNIRRGGLFAHILWLFYKEPQERSYENVPDLRANRLVMFQYKFNNWIGLLVGLGLPTLVGAAFGRPVGGLLWGGFLRIALIHHTTFLVNSVAHLYGSRPYTEDNSARDNALLAFLTNGEGYHNFHHKFPSDFRNGVRWYHWDPTKWWIGALRLVGLAFSVNATPRAIVEKTRLRMQIARAESRLGHAPVEIAEIVRLHLERAKGALDRAGALWHEANQKRKGMVDRGRKRGSELARAWRRTRKECHASLFEARREWRGAARLLGRSGNASPFLS